MSFPFPLSVPLKEIPSLKFSKVERDRGDDDEQKQHEINNCDDKERERSHCLLFSSESHAENVCITQNENNVILLCLT